MSVFCRRNVTWLHGFQPHVHAFGQIGQTMTAITAAAQWKDALKHLGQSNPLCTTSTDEHNLVFTRPKGDTHKILILDASFNPPHLGHRILFESAWKSAAALNTHWDAGILMHATKNVDKTNGRPWERLVMMERLHERLNSELGTNKIFVTATLAGRFVDKQQIVRDYMRNVLGIRNVELYFIMGADTLIRLFDKKYYVNATFDSSVTAEMALTDAMDRFFQHSKVLCAERVSSQTIEQFLQDCPTARRYQDRIIPLKTTHDVMNISSTKCRSAIDSYRAGRGKLEIMQKLMDPEVIDLILQNNLCSE